MSSLLLPSKFNRRTAIVVAVVCFFLHATMQAANAFDVLRAIREPIKRTKQPAIPLKNLLGSKSVSPQFQKAVEQLAPGWLVHKGPVEVEASVWVKWSGDGPAPGIESDPKKRIKEGEISCIWYITGERGLAELETEGPRRKATPSMFDRQNAAPLFRRPFIVYPAEEDFTIKVKVYDQDRIGDQKALEIRKFLTNVGAEAKNLYPAMEPTIPVIQELLGLLLIDLPNLFLDNDELGQSSLLIHRKGGVISVDSKLPDDQDYIVVLWSIKPIQQ